MAKSKSADAPTKTDIVRDYLKGNPTATGSQIVTALKEHGISPALAAKVKSRYGKKKPGPKAAVAKATAKPVSPTNGARGAKAEAIRAMAKSLPKPIRPRDVRAELAKQGIDATTTFIGKVLRAAGMKRKRRRKAAAGSAALATAATTASLSINDLVAAKKLVGVIGSIEKVRETLTALARLG